jgi:hypothetical protein
LERAPEDEADRQTDEEGEVARLRPADDQADDPADLDQGDAGREPERDGSSDGVLAGGSQPMTFDEFAAFVDGRFTRSGFKPEDGLGAAIVDLAGNLPYDVQRLAHETWDQVRGRARRRATFEDLHDALRRLLTEQQMMFEAIWQRLTLAQRGVLRAVVLEDGRELLSADVRTRHRLGGPSTVQAALAALVREDLIARDAGRYGVVDSLLREWVARQTF